MNKLKDLWIGRNGVAPLAVNLTRGVAEVMVLAGIGAVIVAFGALDLGEYAVASPFVLFLLNRVAGVADNVIDPTQNRGPQIGGVTITGSSVNLRGSNE